MICDLPLGAYGFEGLFSVTVTFFGLLYDTMKHVDRTKEKNDVCVFDDDGFSGGSVEI